MLFKVAIYLFLLILSAEDKLLQVFSISRHGSRYHVMDFSDGNQTLPMWQQLTPVGKRQLQRLGQLLRKEFIDDLKFLSPHYNPKEIEAFTSQTNRTYMSLSSLLYGLYPPGTGPVLTPTYKYLHLPPYSNMTDIKNKDSALPNSHQPTIIKYKHDILFQRCKSQQRIQDECNKKYHYIVQELNKTQDVFIQRMSRIFNFSREKFIFKTFSRCYDSGSVDLFLGRSVPADFTNQDYKRIQYITNWYIFLLMEGNHSVIRNTPKFKRMINNFDQKIRNPDSPLKWTFMSCHDYDIAGMSMVLNLSSAQCSEQLFRTGRTNTKQCQQGNLRYGASIIIQLHSHKHRRRNNLDNYYVKVRFNGKYMKICRKKRQKCPYKQFKEIAKQNMDLKNLNLLCQQKIISDEVANQSFAHDSQLDIEYL